MTRRVAVFGASRTALGSEAWRDAEALGEALVERGWAVWTGGYGGTMEAVSRGAARAGGEVVGVTLPAAFPDRTGPNVHLTREIAAPTLLRRIDAMIDGADAFVALPGSLGTFTELMTAWNALYLERRLARRAPPLVAVGPTWERLIATVAEATGAPVDGVLLAPAPQDVPDLLAAHARPVDPDADEG